MQTITKYRALDGSEWNTAADCIARDNLVAEVKLAMSVLKPTPTDMNWGGYVQQKPVDVRYCKEKLYEIANQEGILRSWIDRQKNEYGKTDKDLIEDTHPSWFGRMLDGGHRPLANAYSRLCCIDSEFREWEQPYYANNPGEGKLVQVG